MAKKLSPQRNRRTHCSTSSPTTATKPTPTARLLARRRRPSQVARARVAKSNLPKAIVLPFDRQCIAGVFGFDFYVQKAGRGRNRKARCIDTPRVYSTNPYSICVSRRQILASFSIMSKTITSTPFRCPWLQAPLIRVVGMAIQCTPLSGQSAAPA